MRLKGKMDQGVSWGVMTEETSILTGAEVVDGQQTTLASVRLSECPPPGVQSLGMQDIVEKGWADRSTVEQLKESIQESGNHPNVQPVGPGASPSIASEYSPILTIQIVSPQAYLSIESWAF